LAHARRKPAKGREWGIAIGLGREWQGSRGAPSVFCAPAEVTYQLRRKANGCSSGQFPRAVPRFGARVAVPSACRAMLGDVVSAEPGTFQKFWSGKYALWPPVPLLAPAGRPADRASFSSQLRIPKSVLPVHDKYASSAASCFETAPASRRGEFETRPYRRAPSP